MSTGYTKPKRHELQEDLKMIAELPDRITEFKQVRLKEILNYINQEKQNRLKVIDHLLIHNPGSTFEHWARNIYSVFNLNELNSLKDFIINHLNNKLTYDPVFNDAPSQHFFEFLFYKFIKTDNTPKTAVQYIFRLLYDKPYKTKFQITGTRSAFAIFYNNFLIGKVPKEEIKNFEIKIDHKEPSIKELYRIGNLDKRGTKFDLLLLEFDTNNNTVG